MHDGAPRAAQGFIGSSNEFGSRLREHLNGHIIRDQFMLDDLAHEIEVGLRGGGKANLDFLEADFYQHVEHTAFASRIHGLDQRLIAVPQVDTAPLRRRRDEAIGPGTVGNIYRGESPVLGRWITQHGYDSLASASYRH